MFKLRLPLQMMSGVSTLKWQSYCSQLKSIYRRIKCIISTCDWSLANTSFPNRFLCFSFRFYSIYIAVVWSQSSYINIQGNHAFLYTLVRSFRQAENTIQRDICKSIVITNCKMCRFLQARMWIEENVSLLCKDFFRNISKEG